MGSMDQQTEGPPPYKHIERNDFVYRKHKKQKEEDIAICLCWYEENDHDSACGERCLNVLTSTECTPGYCPCGIHCKNQKFQKCEYAKSKLFKTEGRGWGLLADENIKAGHFIIEYCGEVISWKEARRRSQAYEAGGLKDAFIISLNAYESIDATKKGSLARFINHSCQPNCETRKWTVLGEIRVGIFAKQDIPVGTELSYDYNFEWYGGAKVRCLCGAVCCSGFLGAKSRGFQEATYLWEDDDDRYSVENIPLYDSEEDGPTSMLIDTMDSSENAPDTLEKCDHPITVDNGLEPERGSHPEAIVVELTNSILMENTVVDEEKIEMSEDKKVNSQDTHLSFTQKNAMISRIRSNSTCRNYHIPLSNKSSAHYSGGKSKHLAQKQVDVKLICQLLALKEAREEVSAYEEAKKLATSQLDLLYDEIRPAIEEHERDTQDSVSTSVAEKWIEASCRKLKTEFDLYSGIIKHVSCGIRRTRAEAILEGEDNENEMKHSKIALDLQ
ncbi:SET domain group 26 isoform X2 [Tasmannia lanceolata]|uniref:SET domain group 26 isoform X2 n=1 Tax=Tasmannia lanceolata TaxID=3420 RepID=UPI0040640FF2